MPWGGPHGVKLQNAVDEVGVLEALALELPPALRVAALVYTKLADVNGHR